MTFLRWVNKKTFITNLPYHIINDFWQYNILTAIIYYMMFWSRFVLHGRGAISLTLSLFGCIYNNIPKF